MTESQASFLKRFAADAGQDYDATLSKAAASRRIDELLKRGKGESDRPTATRRSRKASASRPAKATGGMSEAQSGYLQELAEEEGGEFDPDLTKEEGARRIGEVLIKQMARGSPEEPPFLTRHLLVSARQGVGEKEP